MRHVTFCLWILALVVAAVTTIVLLDPTKGTVSIKPVRKTCVLYIGTHAHPEAVFCADHHVWLLHPWTDLGPATGIPPVNQ
jgi:hypothetical protein